MSSPIEGGINDKLQMLSHTDFDGARVAIFGVDAELQLVKEVHESRFFPQISIGAAGAEYLYVYPPKGKIWKILDALFQLVTDANVANRTFSVTKEFLRRENMTWYSTKRYISATVAASTTYNCELHEAASADPPAAVDSLLPFNEIFLAGPTIKGTGQERLKLRAVLKEAGDVLACALSIEERTNYML